MIMSEQTLLGWLGRKHGEPKATPAAELIQAAVTKVIRDGKALTRDLGGKRQTSADERCRRRRDRRIAEYSLAGAGRQIH